MIKKILAGAAVGLLLSHGAFASAKDPMNLSGTYMCGGYDKHDGYLGNVKLIMAVDAANSDPQNGYISYHYNVTEADGTNYAGAAVASGNTLAMYFVNQTPGKSSDQGVSLGFISHDQDTKGNTLTQIHKFYYEPNYQGGGKGAELCTKQS
jgi:hypothetical protein